MMAAGLSCQFCGSAPATVLMTWLANGASVTTCDDDLAPALINILATDLGVDPGKLYEHVKRFVDKAVRAEAAAAGKGTPSAEAAGPAPGTGELTPPGGQADGDAEKFWPGKMFGESETADAT